MAVCEIVSEQIRKHCPEAEIHKIPVADGGEGSVAAFVTAVGGEIVRCRASDPFGDEIEAFYGVLKDKTAVIEMAACAGLPLVEGREDPGLATTYGVGQLMADAIKKGCKRLIIGLGGSATNDMGCGAAAAVGARFTDPEGKTFVPTGETLGRIRDIDLSGMKQLLDGIEIITMCDISNPLYGPDGAAHVFSPQKGADADMVGMLDDQLKRGAKIVLDQLGIDVSSLPGGGAAGGMGAGMVAFFNSVLRMGIDVVLDVVGFDDLLRAADFVISGEGKVDNQTLNGKVVQGIAQRTKTKGIPLIVLSGSIPDDDAAIYESGVTAMFSINRQAEDFSVSRYKSAGNLAKTVDNIMRLLCIIKA